MKLPTHPLFDLLIAHAKTHQVRLYIVGGYVRDWLLGRSNVDLDFVVEGDAIGFVESLISSYGGTATSHRAFITATWIYEGYTIDFATARMENYPQPAVLPIVYAMDIRSDLRRRDFSINAIALELAPTFGEIIDIFNGRDDLVREIIRILHDLSFRDDPTRIFRAIRFEQRFRFALDSHTLFLLSTSLHFIVLLTGERLRHEFDVIFNEIEPERVLSRLNALNILTTIDQSLTFDEQTASAFSTARKGLKLLDANSDSSHHLEHPPSPILNATYWTIWAAKNPSSDRWVTYFNLPGNLTDAVAAGGKLFGILTNLENPLRPSQVVAILDKNIESTLIAAWSLAQQPAQRDAIERYLADWRHIKPTLNGNDLQEMGLKPGKQFGRLLSHLRDAWLDGSIAAPDQERDFVTNWLATHVDAKQG